MNLTDDDLRRFVANGRGAAVDWFPEVELPAVQDTMAAMANGAGGVILLGIDGQPGVIAGVTDASEVVEKLLQLALAVDPALMLPLPQVVTVDGRSVVALTIPRGMPHVYAVGGRFLQRVGAENAPLRTRELYALMAERSEIGFETEPVPGATRDDIDWAKARAYAASLRGIAETRVEPILVKRGCLVEQEGVLRPTHAGILLFGRDPQQFVRGADITAARFASETMSDSFTRQDIVGTLPDQIRRAEMFLVDTLRKDVLLGAAMARAEQFEYPLEAARELVVNAVAHRDYRITGDGIRLFIFSNRMEVTSPGGLPGPVTVDNIKDERFSRNPVIVQVLSDMGYIERLGYGVDRVIDLMRQKNLRAPIFEEKAGGFRVVLFSQTEAPAAEAVVPAVTLSGVYQGVEVNPRQEVALLFLQREGGVRRITNSDLQQLCPDVHPETIRRDLADLVTKNVLRKMGQKRGSYYVLNREND